MRNDLPSRQLLSVRLRVVSLASLRPRIDVCNEQDRALLPHFVRLRSM